MIIEAVDEDGDGEISQTEFVTHAVKIEFISNMLTPPEEAESNGK